jgi:hypothetical protein
VIPVTGGEFSIDCTNPATYTYIAPNFQVNLINLCSYEALVDVVQAPSLPGELPEGRTLVQAIQVSVRQDGQSVNPLPADAQIAVEFEIPEGQQADEFAILFWDNGEWVELDGAMTDDGFFSATAEHPGTFVLVRK